MTELLEHADRDLAEALATYRALLRFPEQGAAQLTRADVLAGAARERIGRARARLPRAARGRIGTLQRHVEQARDRLANHAAEVALKSGAVTPHAPLPDLLTALAALPTRSGHKRRAAVVAVSAAVIGLGAVTLGGSVAGLAGLQSLPGGIEIVRALALPVMPPHLLDFWGCC